MCCLFFIFPFPPASLPVIWRAGRFFPKQRLGKNVGTQRITIANMLTIIKYRSECRLSYNFIIRNSLFDIHYLFFPLAFFPSSVLGKTQYLNTKVRVIFGRKNKRQIPNDKENPNSKFNASKELCFLVFAFCDFRFIRLRYCQELQVVD